MTIIYTVICRSRDATILSEVVADQEIKGTFGNLTVQLMEHLRDHPDLFQNDDMKTFVQRNQVENDFFSNFIEACGAMIGDDAPPEHYFHLFFKDDVYYCCLADDPDSRDQKVNFAYLQHIQQEFVRQHRKGRINTARAYSLDKTFGPTIRSGMHYHNVHHKELRRDAKVQKLLAQVQDMQVVMGRNLNMILERGNRFEGLLEQSESLREDTKIFKKDAKKVKWVMVQQYYYWYFVGAGFMLVFIYLMVAAACGFGFQHCHRDDNNNNGNQNDGGKLRWLRSQH